MPIYMIYDPTVKTFCEPMTKDVCNGKQLIMIRLTHCIASIYLNQNTKPSCKPQSQFVPNAYLKTDTFYPKQIIL